MNRRTARIALPLVAVASLAGLALTTPATAAATTTVALYNMSETVRATLVDSSGNGLNGTIGAEVGINTSYSGAVGHTFPYLAPNTPPAHPDHLDTVPDNTLLDPGTSDYAVTIRYRTTRSFGNILQKGQSTTTGGMWKFQQPNGIVTCVFRGSLGQTISVHSATAINDGAWHTVRCERTATKVTLTVDGGSKRTGTGSTGSISNSKVLSIGGKSSCDQITVTCDYFVGDIDYVRIEKS